MRYYFSSMGPIVQVSKASPAAECIDQAVSILEAGGLVIVPTETVYGIACDPDVPGALDRLIKAKGRDSRKPIARLIASPAQVQSYCLGWNSGVQALCTAHWPGPLTLVLETVFGWIGFRMPDHAVPAALANACGRLLALTSANHSGGSDPCTAGEAAAVPADLILDGGVGSNKAAPSTVVKVDGEHIDCLRKGALPFSGLQAKFRQGLAV